ncbi:MAG: T9SS type A sorting domain-containing protein [Flavobacteriales bacterium]
MEVDAMGNTYAFGSTRDGGFPYESYVVKMDPDGALVWIDTVQGISSYGAMDLSGSDVFICGRVADGFHIARYDTSGAVLWQTVYDDGGSLPTAHDVVVGPERRVTVTGSTNGPTGFDAVTVQYDSIGVERWSQHYNYTPISFGDQGRAVATDAHGNVYVTGTSADTTNGSILTISYSPLGVERWVRRNSPGIQSLGTSIAVEGGRVYVGGTSDNTNDFDLLCAAYDTTGAVLWEQLLDVGGDDRLFDMDVRDGFIALTGVKNEGASFYHDYSTVLLDSVGVVHWTRTHDGGSGFDYGVSVRLDATGKTYVTGGGPDTLANTTVAATICYAHNGDELWLARYFLPGIGAAEGYDIDLDDASNVYVFGLYGIPLVSAGFVMLKYGADVGLRPLQSSEFELDLYPNPAQDQLNLSNAWPGFVTITDAVGRSVMSMSVTAHGVLSVGALASGCYVLHLRDASQHSLGALRFLKE